MKSTLSAYLNRYWHNRHDRLVLGSVLLFLAMIVVVFVYWQLRYVGITMTNETYCGYEEHVHTEECYEYTLVCGLDETDGHAHSEECFDEEGNLICELDECEPHTHSDECYEKTLICGMEEHTHAVSCMIDESADLEDATVWEATLPALTGDLRTDIISIAYSQLDYTESTANYTLGEDGSTHYGYTRYGAWYGSPYADWDSMFVAFCLDYAGIADDFTYNAGAYAWNIDLTNSGYYQSAGAYSPTAGDVVFIDADLDGKADISAIIVSLDEASGGVLVIQGNYNDSVALVEYTIDDSILGYANVTCTDEAETEAEAETETETEAEADEEVTIDEEEEEVSEEPTTLTYEGADYTITVSYGEDAALPEGTELVAYEYAQDSENFLARYAEAAELYGWEDTDSDYNGFRLFNIGLYYDGAEIEPATSVTVTITYTGEPDTVTSVSVTHFGDTETETLDATLTESSVTFTADGFSDFGIALASEKGNSSLTVTYGGASYEVSEVSSFDLTICNNSLTVVDSEEGITNVLSFTADSTTYYLIPVSYLSSISGFAFDSESTTTCPFMYAPYSNQLMETVVNGNYAYADDCYYACYTQVGDEWYVQVTDASDGATPRANIYYCPTYKYFFYVDSTKTNQTGVSGSGYVNQGEESITDFIGYKNYTLIPIEYFSGHIIESSLSNLTSTDTIIVNGEVCNVYTADDFVYKKALYQGTGSSNTVTASYVCYDGSWYLMVRDYSVGYTIPRCNVIYYTGSVGVYTTEDGFYLWIYDELTQVFSSATWVSGTTYNVTQAINDVLSCTSPDDGQTYYYIPVSYFESALANYGYKFDSSNIASCPLMYAPSAGKTLSTASNITTCLFATYKLIDGTWYVQVTDTSGYEIHRSNVYYTEYMLDLYQGSYDSLDKTEYITDYIGIGSRQVLIPVSYFSDYVYASDLEAELTAGTLTESSTITICGTEYTTYTSSTYTFTYRPAYWQTGTQNVTYVKYNNTWYLLAQDTGSGYSLPVRNKICYTGEIEGIVLNLGDVNGSSAYTIYNGNSSSSTALRYTVSLRNYVDDDGNVTVFLPCDDDLDSTFTVAKDGDNTATVTLGSEADNYDYKLIGWINIATGEYYDVSGGSTTATVNINDYDNVFYADWIADSYDCVGDEGTIIETADTSSFVTIQMFDFSELFNVYSASLEQNGLTSEIWTDSEVFYSTPLLGNDVSTLTALGKSFMFFNVSAPNSNNPGNLGLPKDRTSWNFWTGNSNKQTTYYNREYPDLYVKEIIDMLYSTDNSSSGTIGSYYVGESNYLFTYDEDSSFYSYDSATNAAVYQQSDGRFYVYDSAQLYDEKTTNTTFLPYNSYSSSSSTYKSGNSTINYWFGVKIDLNFYLPNDTGTSGGNLINGSEMVFDFRGDDDVWIFVDDDLVLDIGGIHDAIEGMINFSTGEITLRDKNGNTISTTTISDLLGEEISAGAHTLTMYYMERGAGESNLKLSFNTIPEWKYESSTAGTMEVTKNWNDGDDSNRPTSILVGLFERVGTYTSGDYTYEGTTYSFDSDGYSYDPDKYVNAYISNGYVYIRVDTETLSESNSWTYTWTLLDSEKSEHYQILELTTNENYTTTYSYTQITKYNTYWAATGYETLNGDVEVTGEGSSAVYVSHSGILKDGLQILLTDGSQNGVASSSGFPTTYSGYVIDVSDGSIVNTEVQFSQAAIYDDTTYRYTYGVTTGDFSSEIWTVEMAGGLNSFTVNGVFVYAPTFYLKDSTGKYLSIAQSNVIGGEYELVLVSDKSEATAFSYNTLGELNTEDSPGLRIVFENGKYLLVDGRYGDTDTRNVKIYIPTTTTIGSSYTITNTILPSITLEKVEMGTDKALSGVEFAMYQKDDSGDISGYYLFENGAVTWDDDEQKLTTDANGTITYKYLPDGTYYLSEISTLDGYNLLTDELWFTISDGKVTAVSDSVNIEIDSTDADSLTIIVKNTPGVELPSTGSAVTPETYALAGGIICLAALGMLLLRRRRGD